MEQTFDVELVLGLEDTDNIVTISPNPATNMLLVQTPNTFQIDFSQRHARARHSQYTYRKRDYDHQD